VKRRDLEWSHLLEAFNSSHPSASLAMPLEGCAGFAGATVLEARMLTFELQAHREAKLSKPAKASLAMPLRGRAGSAGGAAYGTD
jgi:hypothetical protein